MWTSTHACWNCRFPFLGKVAEPGQDTGGGGPIFSAWTREVPSAKLIWTPIGSADIKSPWFLDLEAQRKLRDHCQQPFPSHRPVMKLRGAAARSQTQGQLMAGVGNEPRFLRPSTVVYASLDYLALFRGQGSNTSNLYLLWGHGLWGTGHTKQIGPSLRVFRSGWSGSFHPLQTRSFQGTLRYQQFCPHRENTTSGISLSTWLPKETRPFLSAKRHPRYRPTHWTSSLPPTPPPAEWEVRGSGTYSVETLMMVVRPK